MMMIITIKMSVIRQMMNEEKNNNANNDKFEM